MFMKKVLSVAAALFCLVACNPEQGDAVSKAASDTIQTLTSMDGKISISVHNSHFSDIIADSARHPKNVPASSLILLQHDPEARITIYAANNGPAQTDAKTYFAELKTALQSDETQNVRVGIATDNRMNYQTDREDRQGTFNQYCIAIHEANIYTVCAYSHHAGQKELSEVLKELSLSR
jgi:hypothetical protein